MAREHTLQLGEGVSFDPASGQLRGAPDNLHPNFRAVYEIVGRLRPRSVLEVACGGGDQMANLTRLYPGLDVRGVDRSPAQLALAAQRNAGITGQVEVRDMTMPWSTRWAQAELVYSQAVIMHINTAVSHLVALSNMFRLAQRHVVLMENYACHPFHDDVRRLFDGGQIDWPDLHAYAYPIGGRPYCLLYSRDRLDLPVLERYTDLPGADRPKYRR